MLRNRAVSEVIGTLVLVAVVMIGIAIVGLFLFASPPPTKVPVLDTIISNRSNTIYILHKGGDPLWKGQYKILVDGGDQTANFSILSPGSEPWSVGETLTGIAPVMPKRVVLIFNQTGTGGNAGVIGAQDFVPGAIVPQAQDQGNWYVNAATGACNWKYRKTITIKPTGTADQSNFPVLISSTDPDLQARALATGNDILFTSSDGTTRLSHEIENYTSGTGTLVAWVKVPSLSSSADTVLYMYYGNASSSTSQEDPAGVWSNGYSAVWHLKEKGSAVAGEYKDSTSNPNGGQGGGGTVAQVPSQSAGKIYNAQNFDTTNDNIQAGSDATIDDIFGSGGTFSAWIYPVSLGEGSDGRVLDKSSGANGNTGWTFGTYTNNVLMFKKGFGTTRGYWSTPTNSLTLGAWQYVVVRYDQSATGNDPNISINNVFQTITEVQTPAGAVQSDAANSVRLGNRATGYTFGGIMDEVRASKTVRTPEWIATEYANQNNPSGFYTIGTEEQFWKC